MIDLHTVPAWKLLWEMPGGGVPERTPRTDGYPPNWSFSLELEGARDVTALVSVHGDTWLEALGALMTWRWTDFDPDAWILPDATSVQPGPRDTILVVEVEPED